MIKIKMCLMGIKATHLLHVELSPKSTVAKSVNSDL